MVTYGYRIIAVSYNKIAQLSAKLNDPPFELYIFSPLASGSTRSLSWQPRTCPPRPSWRTAPGCATARRACRDCLGSGILPEL